MSPIDQRVITRFCSILCAPQWPYKQQPVYYYRVWKRYLKHGDTKQYYWDKRKYKESIETDKLMAKYIHRLYRIEAGLNVMQLEISWS